MGIKSSVACRVKSTLGFPQQALIHERSNLHSRHALSLQFPSSDQARSRKVDHLPFLVLFQHETLYILTQDSVKLSIIVNTALQLPVRPIR